MRMRNLAAVAAVAFLAGAAQAQVPSSTPADSTSASTFKGFRIEAQAGLDRFQSQGEHKDKFGYGVEAGWDGQIGNIVVGPYASYWRGRGENITTATGGSGLVAHKSFNEIGAGVRAGYQVTPALMVFGQGGYVNSEQRRSWSGQGPAGTGRFYDKFKTDGYQLGGGVEYSIRPNVYVKAAYRYSNYEDNTVRQAVIGGVGMRF